MHSAHADAAANPGAEAAVKPKGLAVSERQFWLWRRCLVVTLPVTAFIFVTCVILFATGSAQYGLEALGGSGPGGHALLISLFIYSGLPFGAGYTAFLLAAGYSFGWLALLSFEVGAAFGACVGYLTSRRCLRAAAVDRMMQLNDAQRNELKELWKCPVQTFCIIALLRNSLVLTFGMANAIAAVSDCSFGPFIIATLVAVQPHGIMHVGIGCFIRELSEGQFVAGGGGRSVGEVAIHIANLVGSILLLGACTWCVARRLCTLSTTAPSKGTVAAPEPASADSCLSGARCCESNGKPSSIAFGALAVTEGPVAEPVDLDAASVLLMSLDTGNAEARSIPKVTCLGRARTPRNGASAYLVPYSRRQSWYPEACQVSANGMVDGNETDAAVAAQGFRAHQVVVRPDAEREQDADTASDAGTCLFAGCQPVRPQ